MTATETAARELREWATGTPGRVDRKAGVIYGVRVLGRFSRNSHGVREARNGTEYSLACLEAAVPLYEGSPVYCDHGGRGKARGVADLVGKLRRARVRGDAIRADLHLVPSHPLAPRVLDDAQSGAGHFGLSHDATSNRERIDHAAGKLVIESIGTVRSVDLVTNAAANKTLFEHSWEAPQMKTTLRRLLERHRRRDPAAVRRVLEMDAAVADDLGMDTPVTAPAGDPHAALTAGFRASVLAVFDNDTLDAAGKVARIKELLVALENLTADDEHDEALDPGDPDAFEDAVEAARAEGYRPARKPGGRRVIESGPRRAPAAARGNDFLRTVLAEGGPPDPRFLALITD